MSASCAVACSSTSPPSTNCAAGARQHLQLHVDGDTSQATQAFQDVPGVVSATATGDVIDLVVEGSVDAALKAAATLTVRRLVTLDSDLEDSFLAYYHDDQPG